MQTIPLDVKAAPAFDLESAILFQNLVFLGKMSVDDC